MSIQFAVIKRGALHKGEIGLFAVDTWADDDLQSLGDATAWAEISTPHNLQILRYLWAIAQKLADGGLYIDKNVAMDDLRIRAGYYRPGRLRGREIAVPMSLSGASYDLLRSLADKFIMIVCSELLPEMPEGQFRRSLEEMIS